MKSTASSEDRLTVVTRGGDGKCIIIHQEACWDERCANKLKRKSILTFYFDTRLLSFHEIAYEKSKIGNCLKKDIITVDLHQCKSATQSNRSRLPLPHLTPPIHFPVYT